MNITRDIKYVGVYDTKIDLFEGQYKVPDGVCYNSYVIIDEKIAVMDSVDAEFAHEWLDNVRDALAGRRPDYLVVHHMEPDHSANIMKFLKVYPEARVVASAKAFSMIKSFFGTDLSDGGITVKDGDELPLGTHTLKFISASMVHWPEVILSYDSKDKILFSADAFGRFGDSSPETDWVGEARRYYIGIVGKYGAQVLALLKKVESLDVETICPLHGPVLNKNLGEYINLYKKWASYEPEEDGILIAYASIYGNTKRAALLIADMLKKQGAPRVEVIDLARADKHETVALAFKYSKLVLAATTYNADVFPAMREFILDLVERGYKNRKVALIENGSWAPMAAKKMRELLGESVSYAETSVKILSALSSDSTAALEALSEELTAEYAEAREEISKKTDTKALFNVGYGLYVVTSNDGERDNGLIVNTVTQVTNTPNRIAVTINKDNYSHHVIKNTGKMNVCFLTTEAPFKVFEAFGFVSGRTVDKFKDCTPPRSDNGLVYLPKYINSYISLDVVDYVDLGTHGMFICSITESRVISDKESMTYAYYHKYVKPKPAVENKKGYVCKICGFIHDEETIPEDFICPICGHGREDFEKIQ